MIFLSLKTYKEASGDSAIQLARIIQKVSLQTGVPIIPCAQPTDIYRIKQEVGIEVWAQHADPIDPGRNFGWLSPYSARQAGATGVVINHTEHPVSEGVISQTIQKAKEFGLKTLVLCETIELAKKVSGWNPDYVGYEKGDLISGPVAMIDVEEKSIKDLAKLIPQPLIVGAGISTKDHVTKTVRAGGKGIILASAFVKAQNSEEKLRELASGFTL